MTHNIDICMLVLTAAEEAALLPEMETFRAAWERIRNKLTPEDQEALWNAFESNYCLVQDELFRLGWELRGSM